MEAILIKPKNKKEQDFALDLVKKLNFTFELQETKQLNTKAKHKKEEDVFKKYKDYPLAKELNQGLQEVKAHINGKKKLKRYQSV
jgi:gamma-glutamyl phosphate reductase